eukprot:ctg_561.g210
MDGTSSGGGGGGGGEDASVADEWPEPGEQEASKWGDGGRREVEPNGSRPTEAADGVSAADVAPAPFPFSESGTLVEVRLQLLRLEGIRLHGAGATSSSSTPKSLKSVALRRTAELVRLLRGEGTRLVRVWLEWLGPDGQALFSTHDVDVNCRSRRADFRHQEMVGYSLLFGGPTDDVPVRLRLRGSTRYRQRFSPHVLRLPSAKVDPVRQQELLSSPDALTHYLQSLSVDESVALSPKPFPPDRWHQWPYHKVPDDVDRAPDFLDESSLSPRPGNRHHRHHQRSPVSSDTSDRRLRFPNQLGVHGDPDDVSHDFDHWDAVTLGTFEVPAARARFHPMATASLHLLYREDAAVPRRPLHDARTRARGVQPAADRRQGAHAEPVRGGGTVGTEAADALAARCLFGRVRSAAVLLVQVRGRWRSAHRTEPVSVELELLATVVSGRQLLVRLYAHLESAASWHGARVAAADVADGGVPGQRGDRVRAGFGGGVRPGHRATQCKCSSADDGDHCAGQQLGHGVVAASGAAAVEKHGAAAPDAHGGHLAPTDMCVSVGAGTAPAAAPARQRIA